MAIDSNIVYPPNSETDSADCPAGFNRYSTLVTPAQLKAAYLWGAKLTTPDGLEMPEAAMQMHISSAISFIEHLLNITIVPTTFKEYKDYRVVDYSSWCFLSMNHYPIIDVEKFQVQFIKENTTLDYPKEWYRIYSEAGQIQLTPTAGTLNSWTMSTAGVLMLPGGISQRQDFPQLFYLEYVAGFEKDKIPFIINDLIAKWAAVSVLSLLGNVVIAPGIVGYSISMDGLAESKSKNPIPYQHLIQMYLDSFNQQTEIVKNYYKRINMVVA